MYPFGVILDGKIVASKEADSSSLAVGDRRFFKYGQRTLDKNTPALFKKFANQKTPGGDSWNESIVHEPKIKAIFLDEKALERSDRGDKVREYFSPDQQGEIKRKYEDSITYFNTGVPSSGEHAGKEVFVIERTRTGMEKALAYAEEKYPELPVYIQRDDGIYTKDGIKVDAKTIYQ